jgi:Tol biopolymer transport system component/tRNA A-37 threonylcarbamoyl transferase component Bud32
MALGAGTRLGSYEIVAPLGAGGMGEVYRARDTKLNREVALKILPETLATDPERLARFTREAQTLAALNHPHIAHIHGLEDSWGAPALVMELVEGENLGQRLTHGAIPLDEALAIARQIADALEAAHEKGIIHRDLKPANIMLTAEDQVKVLDFGLAKAFDSTSSASANAMNSPTLSVHATQAGIILGTAAYMAPEQARGKAADKRADVWAFGVVLFEMLTGRRAFEGGDISITLASVMMKEPNWGALPSAAPLGLRRLLTRCLKKDPKTRMRDIGEARAQIEELLSGAPEEAERAISRALPLWRRALPWAVVGALSAGWVLVLVLWAPWRTLAPPASPAPLRVSVDLGADASLAIAQSGTLTTLSPDGSIVAFVAQKGGSGSPQLYLRSLTRLQATPLAGTDNAESPFFSPDGQWIAFFAGGKLMKISVTGGAAVVLCDAPLGRGGAWGEDGTIVLSPDATPGVRLLRVSSAGGTPVPLPALAEGEVSQRWPQVLPGAKAMLFTGSSNGAAFDDANLVVQPLPSGARKVVQRGGYHGRYLASGHLVYIHDGTLFAAPFDLDRLEVTGPPVPALEGVMSNSTNGGAQFAVSAGGTLAYLPGRSNSAGVPVYWMDREGRMTSLRVAPANWLHPHFAPDGRRLAMQILDGQSDIWVYEWERDTLMRLTFDPANDQKPVWTPDGRRIAFASARADKSTPNLYWQSADGTGDAQRLTESKNLQGPASWHPSGKLLAFEELNPQTNFDLMILPLEGDGTSGWKPGKPTAFLNTPFIEREPMFSPDGRWLAYQSTESGHAEVYVRPFPGPGGKWQVSTGGGVFPTWSRTKRELLYGTPTGQIMVAAFTIEGDSFRAEAPRHWSDARYMVRGTTRPFDLHPDGERVALALAAQTQGGAKQDHVTFVFNFFDELRRMAPVPKDRGR